MTPDRQAERAALVPPRLLATGSHLPQHVVEVDLHLQLRDQLFLVLGLGKK